MFQKLNHTFLIALIALGCNSVEDKSEKNGAKKVATEPINTTDENKSFNLNSNFKFNKEEQLFIDGLIPNLKSHNYNKELENYVNNYIRIGLKLDSTIGFNTSFFKENVNNDSEQDIIIALNLLELAKKKAVKAPNPSQLAQLGFMGDYNYILFFDGASQKILNETVIRSTPLAPLNITFENISSMKSKDVLVDFRILNASYKDYYTIKSNRFERIFQWKNFDGLGKEEHEAYTFEYDEGTMSLSKDIIVSKAKLKNPSGDFDKFTFEPEIIKTKEIFKRFFFHPERGIYMTR
jgi:hypothetical protein